METCQHHFMFPSPNGTHELTGTCKHCGVEQTVPTTGGHDHWYTGADFPKARSSPAVRIPTRENLPDDGA